jgi:nucleoside-diphosphate-sugar epimerase
VTGRILITGGAGFIGTHLARRLAISGYTVALADNFVRGIVDQKLKDLLATEKVTVKTVELLDLNTVLALGSKFDAIFHLAAIVGVSHVVEHPYQVLVENVRMVENVIALARQQENLSRLLFSSTSEVYAGTLKHFELAVPTPEDSNLAVTELGEPRTSYMLSKIFGEALCQQAGIPFTIFRPHNVYGPRMGMAHVIPEQLKKAWLADTGDSLSVHSSDHRRSFCFVDDAVEMLKRMLEVHECEGKTLNLGAQFPEVTIREVVQMCIDVTGKSLGISDLPPTPGSPNRRAPDMRLTNELLGVESRVSLREGIEQTWAWYREHVFVNNGPTAT